MSTTTTTPATTGTPPRGRTPGRQLHDNDALLADLVRIDAEGWNGPVLGDIGIINGWIVTPNFSATLQGAQ